MSEAEAAKAIEAYFEGFNTRNQELYLNTLHSPFPPCQDQ
jgi:hypothetical protein